MLACQYSQPKRPGELDLESGVRVECDMGYLCAILVFLGLSVLRDRQTSDSIIAKCPA